MQEIPKSLILFNENDGSVVRQSLVYAHWCLGNWRFEPFIRWHQATFQFLLMKDQKIVMKRWTEQVMMWFRVWNVFVAFFIFTGSWRLEISGWIFMQNGKWWLFNLVPQDTGIKCKSEVHFELCTPLPLSQLRTKKNSEMIY